jgi:single-strand DNA-binding protein
MSKSVNKVTLLGNVGQAPETRSLSSGTLLTTISLATNDRFKQGEEWKDRTEWHSVLFYGRLAEIARDYLRKGSKVYVEGRIRTDSWDDKETGRKCWRTHIVAIDVVLLDSRESRPPQTPDEVLAGDNYGYGSKATTTAPGADDDGVPF